MNSLLIIASIIVKLSNGSDGFNTKICVLGAWGWLSDYDGEYEYQGMHNGAPLYTQVTCTTKPQNCNIKRTLSISRGIQYAFTAENGDKGAYCDVEEFIDRPNDCKLWWGWGQPYDSSPDTVRACGQEQSYTPSPTLPSPTYITTDYNWNKPDEYNLINPYPESYYGKDQDHFCDAIYSQSENQQDITHPNYEERLTAALVNMARLFPDYYWYKSKYGAPNYKYDTEGYCGKAASTPLYYNQKANEATRFHQWDQMYCDGDKGHTTCSDPYRCDLFSDYALLAGEPECNAAPRWYAFKVMKPDDNLGIGSEGICGQNGCYLDGHCSAIFDPGHSVIGIGKWKGSSGYDIVYGEDDNKKYPIVYGAHIDGRYYWNYEIPDTVEKITFLLQWYHGDIRANSVYLLYENDEHSMTRVSGNDLSGFYEVEFEMNSDDNQHFCEPYAFSVEASDGNTYRLPENNRYFFGTAFFPSYNKWPLYECNENHYYKNDNNQWIANGGPLNLITSNNGCIGCSKANNLESLNINHYNECPGSDTNCHSVNGYLMCRDGYVTTCPIPLTADCNSACKVNNYNECPGSDSNCHSKNGHLTCDTGYITSCATPLTSNCNSACNAITNGFVDNFQAWV